MINNIRNNLKVFLLALVTVIPIIGTLALLLSKLLNYPISVLLLASIVLLLTAIFITESAESCCHLIKTKIRGN